MSTLNRPTRVEFSRTPSGQLEAFLYKAGRSEPVVCKVLGTTQAKAGATAVYLDRLVHSTCEQFIGYTPSGAVSTVLTGIEPSV